MLINFGAGKCPLCGDFAKELEKKTLHCTKCRIAFNDFFIVSSYDEIKEYYAKYWN